MSAERLAALKASAERTRLRLSTLNSGSVNNPQIPYRDPRTFADLPVTRVQAPVARAQRPGQQSQSPRR